MENKNITIDSSILGGVPVFAHTRVPVHSLWEYLEKGESLDVFLDDFPTVNRKAAILTLQSAEKAFYENTH